MAQLFDEYYKEKEAELLRDICDSIAIPSIAQEDDGQGNPFGRSVTKCLEHILERGAALGFQTDNVDNYVGEITMGSGEHLIGILCHADVVDAGTGWNTEPFSAVVADGELYGRGSIDDKGPMMCCLYAMDYIQRNQLLPDNTRIRMIIGTDEEENWLSIDKYLKENPEIPEISIVPDANFPVISCEKGLINVAMTVPVTCNNKESDNRILLKLESLSGGERANVVAASASCSIISTDEKYDCCKLAEAVKQLGRKLHVPVTVAIAGSKLTIKLEGKAAHAMTPEKGINAISYLMELLFRLTSDEEYVFAQQNVLEFYHRYLGLSYNGEGMNLAWSDEDSGNLTVNVGLLTLTALNLDVIINLRYPVTKRFEEVEAALAMVCEESGAFMKFGVCMNPIYFDKNSSIVRQLMSVYQESTGDMVSQPISLGGATFARAIPNAIAFGPVFPDQEELAHEANEHYRVADYKRITEIYVKALLKLSANI
ncbi:dipeptidase PepV [Anaerotruncus sp. 80]|uniref:Dipeptidase PepV n=1 Tax=Anaerotruncus colihominis TaxID=169435 RepID=A0A845QG80_9FIRM|nr:MULTISPECIES: dipeptidase PepV [Anaerotruncus]MCI9640865.1 dipeptidase PepV [Emergencia sp.]NBH60779.1 dipeptidase PepV [Anaerotruncus colihominis]NCF01433.1 dipeptidase PepV [Anaerotruncus sp. 80]